MCLSLWMGSECDNNNYIIIIKKKKKKTQRFASYTNKNLIMIYFYFTTWYFGVGIKLRTQFLQRSLGGKFLIVDEKMMSLVGPNKNQ